MNWIKFTYLLNKSVFSNTNPFNLQLIEKNESWPKLPPLTIDNMGKEWLGTNHLEGYVCLVQYKKEMERRNPSNIVIFKTTTIDESSDKILKRMFVFFYNMTFVFKTQCRMLLIIDGWEINNPYKSVMLVAVSCDRNDIVFPIALWKVQEENWDSLAFFLKNINEKLHLNYGKGLLHNVWWG